MQAGSSDPASWRIVIPGIMPGLKTRPASAYGERVMSSRRNTVFNSLLIALSSLVVGIVLASRLDMTPASFAGSLAMPAINSEPISGPLDSSTFRTIASQASPSVVSIVTEVERRAPRIGDFFGFQDPRGDEPQLAQGAGSGFIIDPAGFVLTNNHVVAGARRIEVLLAGAREFERGHEATIVGRDELTDVALLKLVNPPSRPLTAAKFGDSAAIASGDWVMAIGNPFGLSHTVTVGVVSATGRQQQTVVAQRFEEMIQTDAAINRGNSGGPLLNLRGEVIGVNTMIVSDDTGGNLGVGFAVPINTISEILPQLRSGRVSRGRIGVTVSRIPMTQRYAEGLGLPAPSGAEVSSVTEGGPAAAAGIRVGDVIVELNGKPVRDNSELVAMVTRTAPGTTVPLKLVRDRKTITLNVTVEELNLDAERGLVAGRDQRPGRGGAPTQTGFGMTIDELTARDAADLNLPRGLGGAVVVEVSPTGSAARAGLQRGDVILKVGTTDVRNLSQTSSALDAVAPGEMTRMVIWRRGQEQLVQVTKR
jgi:serine protease Do